MNGIGIKGNSALDLKYYLLLDMNIIGEEKGLLVYKCGLRQYLIDRVAR
jgi:hypothetical protein